MNLKIYSGSQCNQHCSYCDKLPLEDFQQLSVIEDLLPIIQPDSIIIEGGEPFIYPELVQKVISWGYETYILTNGTLITKEWLQQMPSTVHLKFSLDGPIALHNLQRSNYTLTAQTLQWCQDLKIPFSIGTTCTTTTLLFLEKVKLEILNWAPQIWTLTPQMFTNEGEEGKRKTLEIYNQICAATKDWNLPFGFVVPNFTENYENDCIEILFKNEQIEVHSSGYYTEQKKLYTYTEIEELKHDWF